MRRLLPLFLIALLSSASAADPLFEKVDVFKAGERGYRTYRIPGIVVTTKGTLLAYGEARKGSKSDWGVIDVWMRRSRDGGKSWEDAVKIVNPPAEVQQNEVALAQNLAKPGEVTVNNPVAIVDKKLDAVHFLYCIEYARCYYTRSDDDGRSWSEPVDLTPVFEKFRKDYPWKVLATGPGHGIQLKNGRLIVPVWLSTGTGGHAHRPSAVSVIYSNDLGKTWEAGEIVAADPSHEALAKKTSPLKNPSETIVVELADGSVMLNLRSESDERLRAVAASKDGAFGWTKTWFDEALPEPICMASLVRVSAKPGADRNRIVFANPHNAESRERKNVTAKLSYDEGKTWAVSKAIEPGASGYSDLAFNAFNNEIYCLYERGKAEGGPAALTLARFNVEWLTDGKDSIQVADAIGGKVHIPRKQAGPPGPPTPPEEAVKKMTVPEGFSVEIVAAEPRIANPVGMAIDDRGRFWITESFEYPRKEIGPGRDRIKVLEDTDHDGAIDKVTVFAEGLNIPSGIAVGYGGVWVANSPDILFLRDTDGDLKADTQKVIATGFGRRDTHELPNSLTWGPDGWLYGLNGVFNHSSIRHRGKEIPLTCALFRINPRPETEGEWAGTHDFELFAEGTSNPWGVAWDGNGEAFLSACVIDHLWHLSESGYYHRQGGPYPPHTWKLGSIVEHKHQMAAYCGITWFDSEAYPEEYREKLYMGNIHGGCINADALERRGSGYFATPRPDFVTANDVWHMPVVQKTGPDGCLYILDWYDRYHCYQDANADPEGIDRARGRLYRVRYQDTPRAPAFDLSKETDDELIGRLGNSNVFYRERAQRLLAERGTASKAIQKLVLDDAASRKARMHGLWALIGMQRLDPEFHLALLIHEEPQFRAWGVRAAGNFGKVDEGIRKLIVEMTSDESPDVQRQVVIAAAKVEGIDKAAVMADGLAKCGDDETIPHIVWQNLKRHALGQADKILTRFEAEENLEAAPGIPAMAPILTDFLLARQDPNLPAVVRLFSLLESRGASEAAGQCLASLGARIRNREIRPEQLAKLRPRLESALSPVLEGKSGPELRFDAALLAVTWKQPRAVEIASAAFADPDLAEPKRIAAVEALAGVADTEILAPLKTVLADPKTPANLRRRCLSVLGRVESPEVAGVVLGAFSGLPPELKRDAVELLTQRSEWSRALIAAVESEAVAKESINPMQVRKMAASGPEMKAAVEKIWGRIRTERNPAREKVIARAKSLVGSKKGDWKRGKAVFTKACSACHKMHGEGNMIGPDITTSGRGTLDQLLSNLLDPNLVIGEDYQARIVNTRDGRAIMGLPIEDNDQRIVIRPPTGKDETIARADVKSVDVLPVSLMPEGLEATINEQEMIDLINYLAYDLHPENAEAEVLEGVKLN